jgi:hypothetical protein
VRPPKTAGRRNLQAAIGVRPRIRFGCGQDP